jgi:hypothetical protein
MDGDGDVDLIVGEDSGTLFFVENKGGAGKPLSMATSIPNWKSIQAGVAGKPTIADLNNDGLPDLIIGNRSGFLRYFQNTGTRTTPNFTTTAINSFLGRVDTRALGSPTGFSAPVFFKQNGLWQLVVGSEEGKLYYYDQIEGNLAGNFRLVSSDYGTLREGWQTAPTFADVNGDKKMELVVGNLRGGFAVYSSSIPTGVRDIIYEDLVEVFPNPTSNYFFINKKKDDILTLKIYNTLGQMILSQKMAAPQLQTDFSAYQSGIYFLEIMTDDFKKQVIKIVKQ